MKRRIPRVLIVLDLTSSILTTQLNGGARMLEIDIVYDKPDDKHPAGVYVCHCGEAPHSGSAIEAQRAKDKGLKSKTPLPNWSNGGKCIRLAAILMQIDMWMIANPKEVVFIMPQNNSASVSQFDTEVAAAYLKTGFYVRPEGQTSWPTRTELVASNKRLVVLASDGVDLSSSKYANKKSFVSWKGYIRPKMYGDVNDYNPRTGEEDKFLDLGSFSTGTTDAITARYYNDYDELKKRKTEWTAKGYTRYPTFIQVNQVQTGDALKFVNEINGEDYQVTGKIKKDAAGEWIVNASADTGAAFYSIGEHFKGDKIATGDRGIYFKNEAGYVARMTVVYYGTESGAAGPAIKVLATEKLTAGMTRPLTIPSSSSIDTSKPIVALIEGFGTTKDKVFSTNVEASFTGELCFRAWGTIFGPRGGKCE